MHGALKKLVLAFVGFGVCCAVTSTMGEMLRERGSYNAGRQAGLVAPTDTVPGCPPYYREEAWRAGYEKALLETAPARNEKIRQRELKELRDAADSG